MLITKTYRFKLRPTAIQTQRFEQWLGTCRYVYNLAKDCKETAFKKGISLSYYDLKKQLPDLKTESWIKDVHSQVLQDVVKRLDNAYQNFFRGAGYPKWAVKDKFCSFNFPQGVSVNCNKVKLPKIGDVRFIRSQVVEGTIKQTKVKKEYDGWYVSLTCITERKAVFIPNESQVGMDVGIARYYTLSDGTVQANPRFFYQLQDKLKAAQRSLSKKVKRSKNWYKQLKIVKRLHALIARKRKDFQHQQSIRLVRKYGSIVVEKLQLKNMTKSAKGTMQKPGGMPGRRAVKQKSGLNRSMLDAAHGGFLHMIEYKTMWYGRDYQKVNPKNTSRECPECGHTAKENRKSQSLFICQACSHTANADDVAAINIRGRAVPIVHGGGVGHRAAGRCDGQESTRVSTR